MAIRGRHRVVFFARARQLRSELLRAWPTGSRVTAAATDRARYFNEVQKILGHTPLKTTQRYAHLSQATLLEAVDSLGAVSGLSLVVA